MDEQDSVLAWKSKVTIIVTFDPDTGDLLVDRGTLPRMFANAILSQLEEDFSYTDDEEYEEVE